MPNAKLGRSRLRLPRPPKDRERKKRTRKLDIPPERYAPLLVRLSASLNNSSPNSEEEVREALDPLITKCKWNDWQCVRERDPAYSSSEMSHILRFAHQCLRFVVHADEKADHAY
jgi:hypothetical protein